MPRVLQDDGRDEMKLFAFNFTKKLPFNYGGNLIKASHNWSLEFFSDQFDVWMKMGGWFQMEMESETNLT